MVKEEANRYGASFTGNAARILVELVGGRHEIQMHVLVSPSGSSVTP